MCTHLFDYFNILRKCYPRNVPFRVSYNVPIREIFSLESFPLYHIIIIIIIGLLIYDNLIISSVHCSVYSTYKYCSTASMFGGGGGG